MRRSGLGRLSALLLGVLVMGFLAPGRPAGAAEHFKFMVDWVMYSKHMGFFVAKDKGWYKAKGLDVTIVRGYGSGNSAKAIATGASLIGFTDPANVVLSRAKGLKLRFLASYHDKGFHTNLVLKSSGIGTAKDLEGKRLGVTYGDALHTTFQIFADAAGLKKWTWVNMAPSAKNPSLLAKKVDAIISFATVKVPLDLAAAKKGDAIVSIPWDDYGVKLSSDGIVTTDKVIAEKPAVADAFVKESLRGLAYAIENPKEGIDILVKALPDANRKINEGFWRVALEHTLTPEIKQHGLGYIDPARMKYHRDAITKAYKLKTVVPVEDIYTGRFLPSPPLKPTPKPL
jgi:NitT/TauT family transport system substrate-binding protein